MCLVHAIQALGLQHLTLFEPVVENAGTGAHDGFGGPAVAKPPSKSDTWSEIRVVVNGVLRLVAESHIERQVGTKAPLVLGVESHIYPIDTRHGISTSKRKLARATHLAVGATCRLTCLELHLCGLIDVQ